MKNTVILEIFNFLKAKGITASESEFSEHWLGCCEGYMRKLRQMRAEPSLGSVAICASRLQNAAEQMERFPRYQRLGLELLALSQKCRALVDADSVEFDLV